jgi:hypothetical protein
MTLAGMEGPAGAAVAGLAVAGAAVAGLAVAGAVVAGVPQAASMATTINIEKMNIIFFIFILLFRFIQMFGWNLIPGLQTGDSFIFLLSFSFLLAIS